MSAPGPRMPTIPDRIVIHSDNSPNPSQDHQPPALKQPSAVPQPGVIQAPGKKDETAPVKSRLGFPRKFSDTLELKKIPRELNNIAKLNEHFQRFGTIRNIQVNLNTLTLLYFTSDRNVLETWGFALQIVSNEDGCITEIWQKFTDSGQKLSNASKSYDFFFS